jgi:ribosome-associated protein
MVKMKQKREDKIEHSQAEYFQTRRVIKSDIPTTQIESIILKVLEDHKAEEVTVMNLAGKSDIAEIMIIATGRSDRHIKSTAEYVCDALKAESISYGIEGVEHKNWVLIDTGAVLLHIFNKESREIYHLEALWQ